MWHNGKPFGDLSDGYGRSTEFESVRSAREKTEADRRELEAQLFDSQTELGLLRGSLQQAVIDRDAALAALPGLLDIAMTHRFPQERKGRNVRAGNLRGWHIEFGNLLRTIRAFPDFEVAMAACTGRKVLTDSRLINLYLIIKFGLPAMTGDIIELGTYRGGSALFMATLLKETGQHKRVYACDTFTEMPPTNPEIDMHMQGHFGDTS